MPCLSVSGEGCSRIIDSLAKTLSDRSDHLKRLNLCVYVVKEKQRQRAEETETETDKERLKKK